MLPAGATATSTVSLEDSGFSSRHVTERWPERFGITAASHAIDAIDERLRCGRYHYSLDATSVHVSPFFEIGLRRDGGDGDSGFGVEVGGGVRYTRPEIGLTAELGARGLPAHSVDGYREWGASGSVRYDPYPGSPRGPSFVLSSSRGSIAASDLDSLWRREMAADSLSDPRVSYDQSIGAEVGQGAAPCPKRNLSTTLRQRRLGFTEQAVAS